MDSGQTEIADVSHSHQDRGMVRKSSIPLACSGKMVCPGKGAGAGLAGGREVGAGCCGLGPFPLQPWVVQPATAAGSGHWDPSPRRGAGPGSRCPRLSLCLLSSFEKRSLLECVSVGGSGLGGHVILGLSFPM